MKTYTLKNGTASAEVIPERGGIVTRLQLEGHDLLYLNEDTLYDLDANVRGGIPILFPISGQLENKQYEWEGKTYTLNNHGFARNVPWEVVTQDEDQLTIRLTSTDETKAGFPFDFELEFTYHLKEGGLVIEQTYTNLSEKPMPMYPGFHPYFRTEEKGVVVESDATIMLDYNDHDLKPFDGIVDLNGKKEAIALIDAEKPHVVFALPELGTKVRISYGEDFPYVVLWTEEGKGFVCVEPWMAKNGEFHRKDELVYVKNGDPLKTFCRIELAD
ncbi:aldose epimerase [Halalkalibacter sp. APA_J-10(15)]|uniref:aldose epimerase family protein n=1 Tax=Halalkalibacter sp. APA_J-10(15) TaxID=2933805 RepID=UPI001FF6F67D|nr:aldose epimerase [Halalkalibacter sp. APA_J-10(15)]MCK0470076.1 aldose epimerase [Halalkalibacter sp. APA_J-10(15)]